MIGAALVLVMLMPGCAFDGRGQGGALLPDGGRPIDTGVDTAADDAVEDTKLPPPLEAGLVTTPGHISCGVETCNVPQSMCCLLDSGPTCATSCDKFFHVCDEAADCPTSSRTQVCCDFDGFSVCATESCAAKNQFCRTDAECPSKRCGIIDKGQGVCVP